MACIKTEYLNTYQNQIDFQDHPTLGVSGCLDSTDSIVVKDHFQVCLNQGRYDCQNGPYYYTQGQKLKLSDPFVKYYISPLLAAVDFDHLNQDQNVSFIDQKGFRQGVLDVTDIIQVKRDFHYEQSNGEVIHYSEGDVLDIRDPYVRSTLFLLDFYIQENYYESLLNDRPNESWQRLNLLAYIYNVEFDLIHCGDRGYSTLPGNEVFLQSSSHYVTPRQQIRDYVPVQNTNLTPGPKPPKNNNGVMPPPIYIRVDDSFYGRTWKVIRDDQYFGNVSLSEDAIGSLECLTKKDGLVKENSFDEDDFTKISAEVYALLDEANGLEDPEIIMSSEISETLFSEQGYKMIGSAISSKNRSTILLTQDHVRRIEFLDYDPEARELTVKLTHFPHSDPFTTKGIIRLPE